MRASHAKLRMHELRKAAKAILQQPVYMGLFPGGGMQFLMPDTASSVLVGYSPAAGQSTAFTGHVGQWTPMMGAAELGYLKGGIPTAGPQG